MRRDAVASGLVRDFRPEDKPAVLALFSETLGQTAGQGLAERWNWFFKDCPFAERPPFLVTESNGIITGVLVAFATPGLWQGKEIPMFCIANFLVHRAHRGVGVPLAKAMIDLPNLLIGMPNQSSATLWTHLGSKDWGRPAIFTRVLDIQVLHAKVWRPILGLLLPAWNLAQSVFNLTLPAHKGFTIEEVTDFPADCDELWVQVVRQGLVPKAPGRGMSLMTQRDRRFLRWRFIQCPSFTYQILVARSEGKLVGYAVVRFAEMRGLRRGFLVDLLARPDLPKATVALLQAVETLFRGHQAHAIHCLATDLPSAWRKLLRRHGYWLRTPSFRLMARPNHPGLPACASEEAFFRHVSYADGELDLVA